MVTHSTRTKEIEVCVKCFAAATFILGGADPPTYLTLYHTCNSTHSLGWPVGPGSKVTVMLRHILDPITNPPNVCFCLSVFVAFSVCLFYSGSACLSVSVFVCI